MESPEATDVYICMSECSATSRGIEIDRTTDIVCHRGALVCPAAYPFRECTDIDGPYNYCSNCADTNELKIMGQLNLLCLTSATRIHYIIYIECPTDYYYEINDISLSVSDTCGKCETGGVKVQKGADTLCLIHHSSIPFNSYIYYIYIFRLSKWRWILLECLFLSLYNF